ncbi:MAG: trypsin-like peptidase domain-containing protein [Phycisphaerales bacterium]|nr:MAG: trypsin-like peptidase domain-containing protein [Phycisphaerales bacterium]
MCNVRRFRASMLGIAALCMVCAMAQAQEPMKVGEHYPIHVDSRGSSDMEGMSTATGRVYEITHPGATFMGVHFARFDLAPGDFVRVSDADGGQSYTMEGKGKMNAGIFWSQHVKGDTIVLELVTTGDNPGKGFVINKYGAGFVNLGPGIERICGASDFENAICRVGTTEYDEARAVARLLIQNMWLCTGWLASADSYFITNEHCITSSTEALNTDYEFMAEAPNCDDPNCQLCYTGDIYSGSAFIKDNAALDYSLVQLAGNPAATYGYLEIDNRDAIVGEEMYQPAHPAGRAKEFGWECDVNTPYPSGRCRVVSVTEPGCSSASYNDVGYWADTEGGSSGSPVLAVSSHKVIALHHCHNYCDQGGDPNRGVPIDLICPEIEAYIPSCVGGFCGDETCGPGEDQCNCPEDCGTPPSNEVPSSTCQDGLDNDCDTDADCDDPDCASDPACICNDNGTCEPGEDCNNCPGDCISGGGTPGCGNGTCEPGEDCNSCPADCRSKTTGAPSGRYCCDGDLPDCGNPKCSEDGWSCGSSDPYCCGDGTCEGAEDVCNCYDCGTPDASEVPGVTCQDGIDNDCDGGADCLDTNGDCDTDPACACLARGEPCDPANDLCCASCHPVKLTCK